MGFEAAFNTSQDYLAARSRAQSFYWLINPKEFRDANRICHQLVDYYVKIALDPSTTKDVKASQDRDRKSTRLNSSHALTSRMPSSA